MVESSAPKKSQALKDAHKKIVGIFNDDKMSASNMNETALSKQLVRLPGKFEETPIDQTVDVLFDIAASKMKDDHDKEVLANLRAHIATLQEDLYEPKPKYIDALFFPNKANVNKIIAWLNKGTKTIDIAVFSISHDDIVRALIAKHKAGVKVRVITDDQTMSNKGSDIQQMADEGIPTRTDSSEQYHMHDKLAIVDDKFVLTGSFNWTFSAGAHNQENLLIVSHPYFLQKYRKHYNELWNQFEGDTIKAAENAAATKIQ
jgi:phosphatidylserine/phosphatidylglycerophosphate/cardiolipin synthase-like enzyme